MRVWLNGQDEETVNRFIEAVKDFPQVMECHLMGTSTLHSSRLLGR